MSLEKLRAAIVCNELTQGNMEWAADEIERLRALVAYHEENNAQADRSRAAAFRKAFPELHTKEGA